MTRALAALLTLGAAALAFLAWLNTRDLRDMEEYDRTLWFDFKQRLESEEFSEDITFAGGTWTP